MDIAIEKPIGSLSHDERLRLLDRRPTDDPDLESGVRQLLDGVRETGDELLRDLAIRYDGVQLDDLGPLHLDHTGECGLELQDSVFLFYDLTK